jgi:hypothetical protein
MRRSSNRLAFPPYACRGQELRLPSWPAASPEPAVDQIARSAFLEGVNEVYRPPTGADQDLSPTDSSPAPHGSAGARCVPSKASGIGCGNQLPSPQGDAWLDSVAGANQQVKQMIGVSDPFRVPLPVPGQSGRQRHAKFEPTRGESGSSDRLRHRPTQRALGQARSRTGSYRARRQPRKIRANESWSLPQRTSGGECLRGLAAPREAGRRHRLRQRVPLDRPARPLRQLQGGHQSSATAIAPRATAARETAPTRTARPGRSRNRSALTSNVRAAIHAR